MPLRRLIGCKNRKNRTIYHFEAAMSLLEYLVFGSILLIAGVTLTMLIIAMILLVASLIWYAFMSLFKSEGMTHDVY